MTQYVPNDPWRSGEEPSRVASNPAPVTFEVSSAPEPSRRIDPVIVAAIFGFILLSIVAIAVASYLVFAVGAVAAVVAAAMALVPLAIVLYAVRWIDRWEPEPRPALAFALLWGAVASIAIALIFSFGVEIARDIAQVERTAALDLLAGVVQAPIVEEASKGFGLLLLFWVFRRHFDGPVDGIVYGAMIGVGFAFTENIQYFGMALTSTGLSGVGELFFLRGILSPFAHVMFTACTGVALGFAARRASALGGIPYFLVGLIPAMLLHALWNGAAYLVADFYTYYLVVQVPLFVVGLLFIVFLRGQERRMTAVRLAEYGAAGWFTPLEIALLSSGAGRIHGREWATRHGLGAEFGRFTRNATRLAFARQRVVTGRDRIGAQRDEAQLLAAITTDRAALAALPPLPIQAALPR